VVLRPSLLLLLAAMCVAFAAVIGIVVIDVPVAAWADAHAFAGFESLGESAPIAALASVFADTANTVPFAFWTLLLLGTALIARGPRRAATAALLLAGANVSTQWLKPWVLPVRDTSSWPDVPHLHEPSFPSGHATASMSLALAAVFVAPRAYRPIVSALGVVYTVGVGLALPILGGHFPSDVAGGYLVAGAWSLIALAAERFADRRWPEPGTIRGAAKRAVAPPPRAAVLLVTGAIAVVAALILAPRAREIADYANGHTTVVLVAASLAVCAAAVLGAVLAIVNRRA